MRNEKDELPIELPILISSLCTDLHKIKNKVDFQNYVQSQFEWLDDSSKGFKIHLKEEFSFWDCSHQNLPLVKNSKYSYTYKYTLNFLNHFWDIIYIDTIHGAWIIVDLNNEQITKETQHLLMKHITYRNLRNGIFQSTYIYPNNFIKISYYPTLNKYIALISPHVELFDDPVYSWNKLLDHLNFEGTEDIFS